VEALSRAAEHLAAWTAAEAAQETSAAAEIPAVKVCQAVAVVPVAAEGLAAAPVAVEAVRVAVAAVDAAAVAAEGDNHVNSDRNYNETVEGGRNETSGNTD
jgi:hypothetical protein